MPTFQESNPSTSTTSEYVHVEYDKWETFQLEAAAKTALTARHINNLQNQPRNFQDFIHIQNEYQSNITFKDCLHNTRNHRRRTVLYKSQEEFVMASFQESLENLAARQKIHDEYIKKGFLESQDPTVGASDKTLEASGSGSQAGDNTCSESTTTATTATTAAVDQSDSDSESIWRDTLPAPFEAPQGTTISADEILDEILEDVAKHLSSLSTESTTLDVPISTGVPRPLSGMPVTELLSPFYDINLLRKVTLQTMISKATELECIPEIVASSAWLDSEAEFIFGVHCKSGLEGVSWYLEQRPSGSAVKLERSTKGSDKIMISGLETNNWTRLSGRRKERFLHDLARIQISYSNLKSPNLGSLDIILTEDNPFLPIDDRFPGLDPKIISSGKSIQEYILHLAGDNLPSFLTYLVEEGISRLDLLPGPYPLAPVGPIWSNLVVKPETGNIVGLHNSFEVHSVPWEVAARVPLKLSPRSHARYMQSLKRHWFGAFVRAQQSEREFALEPRLDQLTQSQDIIDCIMKIRETAPDHLNAIEERMVNILYNRKDFNNFKTEWEQRNVNRVDV
jgi:hypothetical protein